MDKHTPKQKQQARRAALATFYGKLAKAYADHNPDNRFAENAKRKAANLRR